MIRSHDGLDSAVSSDAPDVWRLPNVPLIDRRLGYPAVYVTNNRWAPEIPEMPTNTSEWAGSKSAVSPAAPVEFRLGNAVPVLHREHKGQIARVMSIDEYAAYEATHTANVAEIINSSQLKKKKKKTVKPAVAWLSHTQRRDSSRVASTDAPGTVLKKIRLGQWLSFVCLHPAQAPKRQDVRGLAEGRTITETCFAGNRGRFPRNLNSTSMFGQAYEKQLHARRSDRDYCVDKRKTSALAWARARPSLETLVESLSDNKFVLEPYCPPVNNLAGSLSVRHRARVYESGLLLKRRELSPIRSKNA
ncbi:hypothetical protein AURANDRAFT_68250 [Aureococcus anophagefferens]|uniref:Uncharacterized protein n=1 Tax=Aureococcus anophagefferens TaxID=44056 RepID=F0YP01_AURAN|nr:hypothetical protein AURANDRAFT_68250 [Aureococcus anophagefferens]EGB03162.1 hypothetical protein AURANDRAFT_68250 [Aureococcus anophagefferens]|eukprot:XP_009042138.1 hypothetical protein AURANDRAFT_68250 [Aureococcus anophagefferens]